MPFLFFLDCGHNLTVLKQRKEKGYNNNTMKDDINLLQNDKLYAKIIFYII